MASCICSLRRNLLPSSTCFNSLPSIFARSGHVASSEGSSFSGSGDVAAKGSKGADNVGPDGKRANKEARHVNVWAPDPVTGDYRPIDQATEACESAARDKK